MSNARRAAEMAAATRTGSSTSVWSGESVSETTRSPEPCSAASSVKVSAAPPSASSRQLSATVRTASRPNELVTWPVTVSASIRRTDLPLRAWSAEARLTATVVLPTPPFGLKIAITVARRHQLSWTSGPAWSTGPLPSSTVSRRMHMASTRQRIASAE